MWLMSVTLDVSQLSVVLVPSSLSLYHLSGWLKADANCPQGRPKVASRGSSRCGEAGGGGRPSTACRGEHANAV